MLHADGRALFLDVVVWVDKHKLGRRTSDIFVVKLRKRGNDYQVTYRRALGCEAIDRNDAATAFGLNRVSHQAFTVVEVPDVNLLVFANVDGIQQVFVNRT